MSVNDCDVEPGVYPDMPMDEYHSSKAVSSTGLRKVGRSIDHYEAYLADDGGSSKAFRVGTAVHAAVLEPELFQEQYIDSDPPVDVDDMYYRHRDTAKLLADNSKPDEIADEIGVKAETVKDYIKRDDVQKLRVHYINHPPGETPELSDDELDTVKRCRDAVANHPVARNLIDAGDPETSHFWEDEDTGLMCRCRPDADLANDGILVDLKTTRDARKRDFQRSMANYGYHTQGAFYLDGSSAASGQVRHTFIFIAVETSEPYGVRIYRLGDEAVDRGRQQCRRNLQTLADYYNDELKWTGYEPGVTELSLPAWA